MTASAGPRLGESRLATKSFGGGGGTTVERRGVTGGSGVQGVKTLSTEKRNTCIHRATLALPAL